MDSSLLTATPIADYDHPDIQRLFEERGWVDLDSHGRIGAAYTYVKDEIRFGYNASDDLPASAVLRDGYGQCNTKGNLLIGLLRGLGVSSRVHGFTIDKALQRGAIPWWMYPFAPRQILHSWVEVQLDGEWIELEGFILDGAYLSALQRRFTTHEGPFVGFGVACEDLATPNVEWAGRSTYIQKDGILEDYGVFPDPDALYDARGTNNGGIRGRLYERLFRHAMNRTVRRIRDGT